MLESAAEVYDGGFTDELAEYAECRESSEVARWGERWKTERTEAAKELALLLVEAVRARGVRRGEEGGGRT